MPLPPSIALSKCKRVIISLSCPSDDIFTLLRVKVTRHHSFGTNLTLNRVESTRFSLLKSVVRRFKRAVSADKNSGFSLFYIKESMFFLVHYGKRRVVCAFPFVQEINLL